MSKLLIVSTITILSIFAFNKGFTQVSNTNPAPPAATYDYEKPEVDGVGISTESGNTNGTGNTEQYKEQGNTNNQRSETRPVYRESNTKSDNDGDTNKYLNYESNTNYEKKIYKSDNGLHKGWYKKGRHKGRQ